MPMHRDPRPHTDWCARDHRCNLAEHRSEPIVVDLPAAARAVLTRVRTDRGTEYAEILIRVRLHPDDARARVQLHTLLTGSRSLIGRAAVQAWQTRRAA